MSPIKSAQLLQEIAPHPCLAIGFSWPDDVAPVVVFAAGAELNLLTFTAFEHADDTSDSAWNVLDVNITGDFPGV